MISVCCNLCGRDDWLVRFPATANDDHLPDARAFRCTWDGYGNHLQIVECRHCGHVYTNPRWNGEELMAAYSAVEDQTYVVQRIGRERTFAKHLSALEKFTGPGAGRQLLDVGAYIGVFVEVALAHGWQATGLEPSRWATDVAHAAGLPVIQGTLDSEEIQGRRFDVITMWDVIEHLADPLAELKKVYRLLNPGGWFVVHTMDIESVTARLMGRRWPWLMDMHIHYFSRRSLTLFLEKSGFELIWAGAESRYLSMGYLVSRVGGLSRSLGRLFGGVVNLASVDSVTVPVNFGDLMTIYARRPAQRHDQDVSINI